MNRLRGRRPLQRPDRVGTPELALFVLGPALLPALFSKDHVTDALAVIGLNLTILAVSYRRHQLRPRAHDPVGPRPHDRAARQPGRPHDAVAAAPPAVRDRPVHQRRDLAGRRRTSRRRSSCSAWGCSSSRGRRSSCCASAASWPRCRPSRPGPRPARRARRTRPAPGWSRHELAGVPDPPPLSRRARINMATVMVFSQGLQIVLVASAIGLFYVLFGLVAVREATMTAWVGDDLDRIGAFTLFGNEVLLTWDLIRVLHPHRRPLGRAAHLLGPHRPDLPGGVLRGDADRDARAPWPPGPSTSRPWPSGTSDRITRRMRTRLRVSEVRSGPMRRLVALLVGVSWPPAGVAGGARRRPAGRGRLRRRGRCAATSRGGAPMRGRPGCRLAEADQRRHLPPGRDTGRRRRDECGQPVRRLRPGRAGRLPSSRFRADSYRVEWGTTTRWLATSHRRAGGPGGHRQAALTPDGRVLAGRVTNMDGAPRFASISIWRGHPTAAGGPSTARATIPARASGRIGSRPTAVTASTRPSTTTGPVGTAARPACASPGRLVVGPDDHLHPRRRHPCAVLPGPTDDFCIPPGFNS